MKIQVVIALLLVTLDVWAADNKTAIKPTSTPTPPPAAVVEMARQFAGINPPAQVVPSTSGFTIYGQGKSVRVTHMASGWTISAGARSMRLSETAGGGYLSTSTTPPTRIISNSGGFSVAGKDKSVTATRSGKNWTINTDGRNVRLNATSQGGYTIN
jgi:hypothetical protein